MYKVKATENESKSTNRINSWQPNKTKHSCPCVYHLWATGVLIALVLMPVCYATLSANVSEVVAPSQRFLSSQEVLPHSMKFLLFKEALPQGQYGVGAMSHTGSSCCFCCRCLPLLFVDCLVHFFAKQCLHWWGSYDVVLERGHWMFPRTSVPHLRSKTL